MLNGYNYLPGGVTELRVLMAGLRRCPPAGQNAGPTGFLRKQGNVLPGSSSIDGRLRHSKLDATPVRTPTGNGPGYFPNYGILGAPDYQGGWTAEVDFVHWYANNTNTPQPLSDDPSNGGTCSAPLATDPTTCNGLSAPSTYPNPAST